MRHLNMEVAEDNTPGVEAERKAQDFEVFMQELEEDTDLRSQMRLYKGAPREPTATHSVSWPAVTASLCADTSKHGAVAEEGDDPEDLAQLQVGDPLRHVADVELARLLVASHAHAHAHGRAHPHPHAT